MTWAAMRGLVLDDFPSPPGLPRSKREYLRDIDGLYVNDAYNSLSIEGCEPLSNEPEPAVRGVLGQFVCRSNDPESPYG
jgi:hypothetical protein